jgi:uncharacterized protein (TIGR02646 family)
MYCEDSAGHPVEHFWPKSKYPERAFCWENLLVICGKCNSYKQAQFPLDQGAPLLIDPTSEDPAAHIAIVPRQGRLLAKDGSRKGQTTIDVLRLNRWELEQGRQLAWARLQHLLVRYVSLHEAGRRDAAVQCRQTVCNEPFSALLYFLIRILEFPEPEHYLDDPTDLGVLMALLPELRTWVEAMKERSFNP